VIFFFFLTLLGIFSVQLLSFDLFFASAAFTYITFPSKGCLLWHLQFSNLFRFVRTWKELLTKKVTWSSVTRLRILPCIGHVQVVWVAMQLREDVICIR